MRIEVYDEKDEPEEVVRLRLVDGGDCAVVRSVTAHGNRIAGLLKISKRGIERLICDDGCGLPTDDKGRVLLVDE